MFPLAAHGSQLDLPVGALSTSCGSGSRGALLHCAKGGDPGATVSKAVMLRHPASDERTPQGERTEANEGTVLGPFLRAKHAKARTGDGRGPFVFLAPVHLAS